MSNIHKFGNAIRVGVLASDPIGADDGTVYYNSGSGKFRKKESGTWSDFAASEVLDTEFRITDDGDATKKIAFEASAITTGTTRTITMPDEDVDLGLISTAIQSSEKGAANGVATLDADGLIPTGQLPNLAITDVFVVADQTARLALTAERGDVAVQTDNGFFYILATDDPTDDANWKQITAAGAVTMVNGQTGSVTLDTDDINEGATNKYFTDARAKTAAVADTITNGVTDVAPSQNAVFDALAGKLANVEEDTTPSLGGDLDLNSKDLMGPMKRSAVGSPTNFVQEQYYHALTLSESLADEPETSLSFAFATYEAIEVTYKIKEATTNAVRIGKLRVVTNGTDVAVTDDFAESDDVGVSWDAVVNGSNIDVQYTTTANDKTMRADVKRFKA